MKKSLLALMIASVFFTTACEDKETLQKLKNAEQTIAKLEDDLKTTKSELENQIKDADKLTALQYELANVKSELDSAQKNTALKVEIVKLFDKEEIVKHTGNDYPSESFARVFVSVPKTNLQWLNELLSEIAHNGGYSSSSPTIAKAEMKSHEDIFQELLKSAKEGDVIGEEYGLYSRYLGQRNHIATFTMENYTYSGGAHGMHKTFYINVDLNKKSLITLDNLISTKSQKEVKDTLWGRYTAKYGDTIMAEYKDFRISDDFYFDAEGVNFVYPPYELAGFAEGNVELKVYWEEINHFIKPDYRLTEKDGFYIKQN